MRRVIPHELLRRLAGARDGIAAVEFAFVAPVLLLLLLGIYDIGHMAYVTSVLHGVAQEVARNSTLETANTATADQYASEMLQTVAPGATVTTTRKSYYDFSDISRAEAWNDSNANGKCDNAEAYTDENNNGRWDADVGVSGNGGANDAVVFTVSVTYQPLFPVPFITNYSTNTRTLSASAVRKNQPYALQGKYGSKAGTCT